MSYDGSTASFYINGVPSGTNSISASFRTGNYLIGAAGNGENFIGSIDELHLSSSARSADWIATEYSNQSSPATFYTLSSEGLDNTELVTPAAVTLYASQNQQFAMLGVGTCSSVPVNWTVTPAVGSINVTTGFYSAPATISAQQTVTVTATNETNNTSASAPVTLMPSTGGPAGTVFTINGAGFGSAEGASSVTVGGFAAVTLFWSDTQIQVQIPSDTGLGAQNVVVTVGGQAIANTSFYVTPGLTGITISPAGTPASVTIGTPWEGAQLIFSGTRGQAVSAALSNFNFGGGWNNNVNVSIVYQDGTPNGTTLVSTGMCAALNAGCTLYENPVTLPQNGIYTLEIVPVNTVNSNNGGVGSTDITLWTVNNLFGTIASGIPETVTINTPGQDENLTFFNSTPGQLASVLLSNFNFGGSVNVSIVYQDGTKIGLPVSMCGATNEGCQLFFPPVSLPQTGTYTLVIAPINGGTGYTTVALNIFQNLTSPITSGNPVPVTINAPGQDEQLIFGGSNGQVASVQLSNFNFGGGLNSVNVSILNPDGTNLVPPTSMCGALNEGCTLSLSPVILQQTGTYTLQIAPVGGDTGSTNVLLTLTYPNVKMSASLVPAESWLSYPVVANVTLTAQSGAPPAGTVSCSGAGVTSAPVTVSPKGSAAVQINGLPLGKDSVVCSYTSSNLISFSNAVSSPMIESVIATPDTGTVSVTPTSATLYAGQTQQFMASVFNISNQAVNWTVSPSSAGTISATGLFTASTTVTSPQTIAIAATSQANISQSASAVVSLSPPQCASSGYAYQRAIVIDHTKIPNTDQADFPFLFNTTDPTAFATIGNGGHVASPSGNDIIFSTDPAGVTKLDHELEQYDPVKGQVIAWVRIPTLSHTTDTVLYVFYGNASITTSQQNPTGVWDSSNTAVYHLANFGTSLAADSTANGNNATPTSLAAATGQIDSATDGAAGFNGVSSYLQIPTADFASYPTSGSTTTGFSASFGVWFKTASAGVILGQTDGTQPGGNPVGWQPGLYVDTAGLLRASIFSHGGASNQIVTSTAYNDNNWHFAVDTYTNGTEELYVDGQLAGSQQVSQVGYNLAYGYFIGTGETANWPAANGSWLYFNGALDEVSVSNSARSGDWVQAEYSNQSSPSTFYSVYPENAQEVIPSTVSLIASQSQQFTVLGSKPGSCSSPAVTWSMPSDLPGTLTASGLYRAPNSIPSQQTVAITATTLGDSTVSISATATLIPAVTVNVTPGSATLTGGQTQLITANVANTTNTAVTWTVNPAGAGLVNTAGLYTAPATVTAQLTINITATSQADPTQSATATITLTPTPISTTPPTSPQCGSSGYSYQRTIVIDHTKVPNTDQTDFPFLFNSTDQAAFATIANGGQVTSPYGYDIIFSLDPNGASKLDYELEEYDPVHGQVIAWVRIPTLSHTTDTVIYVFYGNPNIVSSQQNPAGVWNSNYLGVYHLANTLTGTASDSTVWGNNGTLSSITAATGQVDGAAGLNGTSSFVQIPEADFPNFPNGLYDDEGINDFNQTTPFSASFGVWFKTASAGGILGQQPDPDCSALVGCALLNYNPQPSDGNDQPGFNAMLYVDDNGFLRGGGVVSTNTYNDNKWHFAVVNYATDGTDTLFVDGQSAGSAQQQIPTGYAPNYKYYVGTAYTFISPEGNWTWLYFNGSIDEVNVSDIPRSGDWIQTEYNNQSSPSTFYTFNPASTAQVAPSAINLYAGQSQQFVAANSCNSSVSWSISSGAPGILTPGGLYTAPDSIAKQQTVTITAAASGTTIGSSVVTLLQPPLPITLVAAANSPYATGSSQQFTATLKDQYGYAESGVAVTFIVNGSNSNLGSSTTDNNGVASYTYTGANNGSDSILATAVINGQQLTSPTVTASWANPVPVNPEGSVALIAPSTLGQGGLVGAFTDNNGAVIEPIAIGAASGEFPVPAGATQLQLGVDDNHYADNGGSGLVVKVNGVPLAAPVPATAMPWNWVTGGLNKNYQYAMNDGTSPVVAATGLTQSDTISIAYQSGTVSTNFPTSPLVNADGDQTSITGTTLWQGAYFPTLYTTASAYPQGQPITFNALVTNGSGTAMSNVPVTLYVNGANVQQLQATTDSKGTATFLYSGANAGTDNLQAEAYPSGEGSISSGQTSVTWTNYAPPPQAGKLTLNYISCVNNLQGYFVFATDASGHYPVFDANVGFYVSGADSLSQGATTDITGQAAFGYYHLNTGAFNIVAVDSVNRNVVISNSIPGQWSGPCVPSNNTITVGISALNTVEQTNTLALNGTVTDSTGLIPQLAWSKVSGPGTVTFGNSSQAVTTATFSQIGTYVIALNASDASSNSGSSGPFTVTVVPAQQDPQGWIGSPANGSAVSGVVPIMLAPGVTLASGNLVYYPANNPNNPVPLKATFPTAGQQLSTLDTTTLQNGSYWIQLQATDTEGQQQYSLVSVTVSGNYKPGRVTATVTDLVVPATGLAINIQRTYDSLNAATSSDFGYGWSLGINVNLVVDPAGNVTFTLGGQRKTFYFTPQMPGCSPLLGCFFPYYFPAYTPESGLHGTLTDSGLGCPALDILIPDGNVWFCQTGGQYNPPGYIYTDPNGTSYTISAAGNLQSIQDLSGNGLTITPAGITSTTGLKVSFARDANHNNRITQITDPANNAYLYGYDANGNLSTVTYPVSAQSTTPCPGNTASGTSTYTYDPTFIHLYAGGTDGRGCPLPTSAYFPSGSVDTSGNSLAGRLESVTDAYNEKTSYAYDIPNLTTTITYPDNNTATMVYDSFGDLLSSTDPNNITTTNTYDANHNLTSVTVPRDATTAYTTSYTYDANGNKTSTTYPSLGTGHNTTSTTYYNQYSEPTSTVDELGNVRFFNYDTNFLPQSVTDSIGTLASFVFNPNSTLAAGAIGFDITANPAQASQFTYDADGNMVSRTDALGRTTSYTYDSFGHKLSMTTPTPASLTGSAASTTSYVYDAMGNLTSTAAPLARATSSTYDVNGNKVSDTDARGNTTYYVYDALNRLVETDYPTAPATKSAKTYDFRNNVLTEIDQAGIVTQHVYDAGGRQTSVTRGTGSTTSTTSYTYYEDGRKATETDPANKVTNYYYDAAGRLTSVSGAQGVMQYGYDDAGNRISSTDGNSNKTSFQYDARKRLIETDYPATASYPSGTSVKNTYDGPGNLASVTDQAGNIVNYAYDAANQLLTVVQHNSPIQPTLTNQYTYDPLGNLTSLEDARSNTTQNLFDLYGEPTQKTLPIATLTESRTYDPAGNLSTLVHFNGKTTTYAYDALNRLLSRSTPSEPSDSVSFAYTATGKYLTSTAQDGTVNYTYDTLDRLATKVTPEGTLSYTYFPTGKVETIVSSNPHGVSAAYTWDDQNRLSTVVDGNLSGQNTTTYSYDDASNVATVKIPNGLTSTFTYDALNRLTELSTPPVADYKYTLGATGIRTNATEQSGRAIQWSYDNIYRLNGETITGDPANNSGDNGSASYTLDPVGNRTAETSSLSGIDPIAGSYNPNDQLSAESYDANGNTTQTANGNQYTYDSENHLIKMVNGSTVVNLIYDAFGNRVAKTVNSVTTQYLVDDLNPTGYAQVVEELTGPIGSGVVTRQYTYGLQRISENLSPVVTGNSIWTASFYGYDRAEGSVRFLSNAAGTVTDTYEYDAFGNQIYRSGTTPNAYMYRDEFFDSDLGLYYLRARYYNPSTGRFLSRDPLDGDPTDPQSLHKYLYAGGDPVNRIDPSGRADSIETIFTITVIATPTEVALSALAGQATAAIALLQMAAGQAYLTAQYAFELIAAAGEATGISKLLVCGAVGLAVARVEAENKITDPEKTAIALLFSYTCSRLVPLPGPPPIKWF
jgi:RHS repeat-associated protein